MDNKMDYSSSFNPEKFYTAGTKVIVTKNSDLKGQEGKLSTGKQNDGGKYEVDFENGFCGFYSLWELELVDKPVKKHDFSKILNENEPKNNHYNKTFTQESYLSHLNEKAERIKKQAENYEKLMNDPEALSFFGYEVNYPMFIKAGNIVTTKYGDMGLITKINFEEEKFTIEDEYGEEKSFTTDRISYIN